MTKALTSDTVSVFVILVTHALPATFGDGTVDYPEQRDQALSQLLSLRIRDLLPEFLAVDSLEFFYCFFA